MAEVSFLPSANTRKRASASREFKLTTYKCISLFKNRQGNFVDLVIVRKKRKFDNNTVDHCSKLAKHHNLVLKVSLRRRVETCDILCHIHAQCNELHLEGLDTWNVTYSISKTLLPFLENFGHVKNLRTEAQLTFNLFGSMVGDIARYLSP